MRSRPMLPLAVIVACATWPACDAPKSDSREEAAAASKRADTARAPSPAAEAKGGSAFDRPILQAPPKRGAPPEAARTFKHYGVGPTVATAEEPAARLELDVDTASFALARAAAASDKLPPEASVRVEAFLAAVAPASAPPKRELGIDVDAVASPQRSGYQLLRVAVRAPKHTPKPLDIVFVVDTTEAMQRSGQIAAAQAAVVEAAGALRKGDRLRVVAVGNQTQELVAMDAPPKRQALAVALAKIERPASSKPRQDLGLGEIYRSVEANPDRVATVAVISCGVLPQGADAAKIGALAAEHAAAGVTTSVLGIGDAPYNDAALERLAHAGGGHYGFVDQPAEAARIVDVARRPPAALGTTVTVQFDPQSVALYRLLGYESRGAARSDAGPGAAGSVLRAGRTATALFEIKLSETATPRWGAVEVRYAVPGDTKPRRASAAIQDLTVDAPVADAAPDTVLALVAAGAAEKLRGSYWARTLTWPALTTLHDRLPAPLRRREDVKELAALLRRMGELDARGDRYEPLAPQARMDFDRLPVLE